MKKEKFTKWITTFLEEKYIGEKFYTPLQLEDGTLVAPPSYLLEIFEQNTLTNEAYSKIFKVVSMYDFANKQASLLRFLGEVASDLYERKGL